MVHLTLQANGSSMHQCVEMNGSPQNYIMVVVLLAVAEIILGSVACSKRKRSPAEIDELGPL